MAPESMALVSWPRPPQDGLMAQVPVRVTPCADARPSLAGCCCFVDFSCPRNVLAFTMKFSISSKLFAFILPFICLPIAIVGYFSFQASVERVDRMTRQELMLQVRSLANEINEIFSYCRLDLKTIAELQVLEDFHNARDFRLHVEAEFNHDNIIKLFTDFSGRTKYYFQIRYLDRNGRELIKVHRDQPVTRLLDQSTEPYFIYARQADKENIHVSAIALAHDGNRHLIHFAKAVYSGLREFIGVVVIDIDHDRIIERVNEIQVGTLGYAFLIDERGRMIAHPNLEPMTYQPGTYPDPSIEAMVAKMMTGDSDWQQYIYARERKMAAYAPVSMMDWSLAVTIPIEEFRKEALAIRTNVVKTVFITLVSAVVGVSILTYFLLRPVRALVEATNRIAGGDLDHEIPIQSSDELGELTGAFNRMVKNLARIQDELVRSEKLVSLGRLSAGVAHEVRNPLSAMKGAIVYLQRRRADDALVKEYTQLVSEEIDRLNEFVSEFLYFAKGSQPRPVLTDVNRMVLTVQHLFDKRATERVIKFHNRLADDLPHAAVDPNQIEQVLVNVLINAMDALPQGGDITFFSILLKDREKDGDGHRIRLTVQDNGIGIPADQLKNIFDPFYSTKDSGTGLGLPICLGIAENHGGHIHITSIEGAGTTVIIEWPLRTQISEIYQEQI
jgi:two-component system, NtrC family, sensor kinase